MSTCTRCSTTVYGMQRTSHPIFSECNLLRRTSPLELPPYRFFRLRDRLTRLFCLNNYFSKPETSRTTPDVPPYGTTLPVEKKQTQIMFNAHSAWNEYTRRKHAADSSRSNPTSSQATRARPAQHPSLSRQLTYHSQFDSTTQLATQRQQRIETSTIRLEWTLGKNISDTEPGHTSKDRLVSSTG